MSDCIIETRGLTKRYGDQVSVSNLDLHVRKGAHLRPFGPQRSGKDHHHENAPGAGRAHIRARWPSSASR